MGVPPKPWSPMLNLAVGTVMAAWGLGGGRSGESLGGDLSISVVFLPMFLSPPLTFLLSPLLPLFCCCVCLCVCLCVSVCLSV